MVTAARPRPLRRPRIATDGGWLRRPGHLSTVSYLYSSSDVVRSRRLRTRADRATGRRAGPQTRGQEGGGEPLVTAWPRWPPSAAAIGQHGDDSAQPGRSAGSLLASTITCTRPSGRGRCGMRSYNSWRTTATVSGPSSSIRDHRRAGLQAVRPAFHRHVRPLRA